MTLYEFLVLLYSLTPCGLCKCCVYINICVCWLVQRLYDEWFDLRLREGAEKAEAKLHIQISFKKQDVSAFSDYIFRFFVWACLRAVCMCVHVHACACVWSDLYL
eukprot:Opistho-2@35680